MKNKIIAMIIVSTIFSAASAEKSRAEENKNKTASNAAAKSENKTDSNFLQHISTTLDCITKNDFDCGKKSFFLATNLAKSSDERRLIDSIGKMGHEIESQSAQRKILMEDIQKTIAGLLKEIEKAHTEMDELRHDAALAEKAAEAARKDAAQARSAASSANTALKNSQQRSLAAEWTLNWKGEWTTGSNPMRLISVTCGDGRKGSINEFINQVSKESSFYSLRINRQRNSLEEAAREECS